MWKQSNSFYFSTKKNTFGTLTIKSQNMVYLLKVQYSPRILLSVRKESRSTLDPYQLFDTVNFAFLTWVIFKKIR